MKYDSKNDTLAHIEKVQEFIGRFSSTPTQKGRLFIHALLEKRNIHALEDLQN